MTRAIMRKEEKRNENKAEDFQFLNKNNNEMLETLQSVFIF